MPNYYTGYNMVKVFEQQEIGSVSRDQLVLNPGDLSGDLISGGTIKEFSSTGIKDSATQQTLVVEDDRITVKSIRTELLDGSVTVRGDVKIYGVLDAGFVRTTELITNQRYEKQYLEFADPENNNIGSGLLWSAKGANRQLVFKPGPDRFWLTEHIDLDTDRSYMIGGFPVLSAQGLGPGVVTSNLQTLGTLKRLDVSGAVSIAECFTINPVSKRVGIGTEDANGALSIYDFVNDVELIFDSNERGYGRIGTFNPKGLEIVTDNQVRITAEPNGDITVGHETKDSNVTRVYGKLSVGVKNPSEQFEVAGNIRWANKLFAVGNNPPTAGSYTTGDVIWNTNPKEGSYVGWVCTLGGAPGLWKPFGMIGQ